jgi:hypothetical protein
MADEKKGSQKKSGLKRRDFLKSLTTIPVFGGFIAAFMAKRMHDQTKKEDIFSELGIKTNFDSDTTVQLMKPGKQIRLGVIIVLMRSLKMYMKI